MSDPGEVKEDPAVRSLKRESILSPAQRSPDTRFVSKRGRDENDAPDDLFETSGSSGTPKLANDWTRPKPPGRRPRPPLHGLHSSPVRAVSPVAFLRVRTPASNDKKPAPHYVDVNLDATHVEDLSKSMTMPKTPKSANGCHSPLQESNLEVDSVDVTLNDGDDDLDTSQATVMHRTPTQRAPMIRRPLSGDPNLEMSAMVDDTTSALQETFDTSSSTTTPRAMDATTATAFANDTRFSSPSVGNITIGTVNTPFRREPDTPAAAATPMREQQDAQSTDETNSMVVEKLATPERASRPCSASRVPTPPLPNATTPTPVVSDALPVEDATASVVNTSRLSDRLDSTIAKQLDELENHVESTETSADAVPECPVATDVSIQMDVTASPDNSTIAAVDQLDWTRFTLDDTRIVLRQELDDLREDNSFLNNENSVMADEYTRVKERARLTDSLEIQVKAQSEALQQAQEQLNKGQTRCSELEATIARLEGSLVLANNELLNVQMRHRDALMKLDERKQEVELKNKELDAAQAEVSEIRKQLEIVVSQVEEARRGMEAQSTMLGEESRKFETERVLWTQQKQAYDGRLGQMTEEMTQLQSAVDQGAELLTVERKKWDVDREELVEQLAKATSELENVHTELAVLRESALQKDRLEAQMKELQAEVDALKKTAADNALLHATESKEWDDERSRYQDALRQMESQSSALKSREDDIVALEQKMQELCAVSEQKDRDHLVETSDLEKRYNETKGTLEELQSSLSNQEKLMEQREGEFREEMKRLQDRASRVAAEAVHAETAKLTLELEQTNNRVNGLVQEKERLEQELTKSRGMESELERLREECDTMDQMEEEFNEKMHDLTTSFEAERAKNAALEELIVKMGGKIPTAQKQSGGMLDALGHRSTDNVEEDTTLDDDHPARPKSRQLLARLNRSIKSSLRQPKSRNDDTRDGENAAPSVDRTLAPSLNDVSSTPSRQRQDNSCRQQ